MKNCATPRSSARHEHRKHLENARFAVSLGAAFALLCAVVFDTPESQAANGLLQLLFGGEGYGGGYVQQAPSIGYGGPIQTYGRHRHARRSRVHYAHARRHVAERRGETRRVATSRATERHHIAASVRRQTDRRDVITPRPPTVDRAALVSTERALVSTERKNTTPIETVSANETSNISRVSSSASLSQNAICVRACDGFFFRIAAKSSGSAAQESCERLCPGSETNAFLLPKGATKVDDAVATNGGETYAQFVARIKPDSARQKSCACPQTAENLSSTSAFLSDLTLRPGDTVVTPEGVRVLRRGSHYPFKGSDFLSLSETRTLPRATRGALAAIDRALKTPYGRLAVASNSERRRHRPNADL